MHLESEPEIVEKLKGALLALAAFPDLDVELRTSKRGTPHLLLSKKGEAQGVRLSICWLPGARAFTLFWPFPELTQNTQEVERLQFLGGAVCKILGHSPEEKSGGAA